jgi:phage terminase small subunit
MPALENPKRERFCQQYVIDLNGRAAAVRAGYKDGSGTDVTASRLLADAKVKARIAELQAKVANRLEITAERVLRETARLAFSDPRKFFNADGTLRPITDLDDDAAAALASFESVQKAIPGGEGETEEVRKFKIWDKPAALGMLGRHLKLFTEKLEVSGDLAAALDRARQRRPPNRN